MSTLWHGRFGEGPAAEMLRFTASLPYDVRLAYDDLDGCRAHVRGLGRASILRSDEVEEVLAALDRVEEELRSQSFGFSDTDEDVHTAIERRVTELAGPAGAKLHTGRSRNDQVVTALRLYVRRGLAEIARSVIGLQEVLLRRASQADGHYMPGYTHLQRAQPVLVAHHLMAHAWALSRDVDRLLDCRRRVDVSPLGAGALAGSSLALQPDETAEDLGFSASFDNSMDAVSDRDFVGEALFAVALLGIHLSRLGEELVLWSSDEFSFVSLHDSYSTGSSMLPQKKNPDIAELVRGKAGRLIGNLTGLLATLKSLPLAYNRDLQEDKEPLFDSFDQVLLALPAMRGLIDTLEFDYGRMQAAADRPEAAAADLAELMVARGIPFREAHVEVAGLVREAMEEGTDLGELVARHPALGQEGVALLEPGVAVSGHATPGGGGPEPVAIQMGRLEARLSEDSRRIGDGG